MSATKTVHACSACITGYYANARGVCTAFCGIDLPSGAHRTLGIFSIDSLERAAEISCSACAATLDAWANTRPPDDNQFRLWFGAKVVAACPTQAAHDAARRLLGGAQ